MVKYIVINRSQVSDEEGLEGTLREPCTAGMGSEVSSGFRERKEGRKERGREFNMMYLCGLCVHASVYARACLCVSVCLCVPLCLCVHLCVFMYFQLCLLGEPGSNVILLDLLSTQFLVFKCSSLVRKTRFQD